VVAIDKDPARLEIAQQEAKSRGVDVEWKELDLATSWPSMGKFDAVMVFNFLDRERMPRILELVAPRGLLMYETFFEAQKEFGWGPTKEAHLLRTGELLQLVRPLLVIHGREVIEPVDSSRWVALASVLAQRV
jgi:2-polyprenyl-3-methyl-5-hydroxy-6-metoxy-1,4-benzoquinol methylase